MNVIAYPCWDYSRSMLVKWVSVGWQHIPKRWNRCHGENHISRKWRILNIQCSLCDWNILRVMWNEWSGASFHWPLDCFFLFFVFQKAIQIDIKETNQSSVVLPFVLGIYPNSSVGFPAQKANYVERVSLTSSCFFGHSTTDFNRFSILMIYLFNRNCYKHRN